MRRGIIMNAYNRQVHIVGNKEKKQLLNKYQSTDKWSVKNINMPFKIKKL